MKSQVSVFALAVGLSVTALPAVSDDPPTFDRVLACEFDLIEPYRIKDTLQLTLIPPFSGPLELTTVQIPRPPPGVKLDHMPGRGIEFLRTSVRLGRVEVTGQVAGHKYDYGTHRLVVRQWTREIAATYSTDSTMPGFVTVELGQPGLPAKLLTTGGWYYRGNCQRIVTVPGEPSETRRKYIPPPPPGFELLPPSETRRKQIPPPPPGTVPVEPSETRRKQIPPPGTSRSHVEGLEAVGQ